MGQQFSLFHKQALVAFIWMSRKPKSKWAVKSKAAHLGLVLPYGLLIAISES